MVHVSLHVFTVLMMIPCCHTLSCICLLDIVVSFSTLNLFCDCNPPTVCALPCILLYTSCRIGLAMIEDAERAGKITPGKVKGTAGEAGRACSHYKHQRSPASTAAPVCIAWPRPKLPAIRAPLSPPPPTLSPPPSPLSPHAEHPGRAPPPSALLLSFPPIPSSSTLSPHTDHPGRAHEWQYRHWPSLHRGLQGLQACAHHARHHVTGATHPAQVRGTGHGKKGMNGRLERGGKGLYTEG